MRFTLEEQRGGYEKNSNADFNVLINRDSARWEFWQEQSSI